MDHFLTDLRFGLRLVAKAPSFALVVVTSLALGIGANAAIFTLVRRMVIEPFPSLQSVDRLVWFFEASEGLDQNRDAVAPAAVAEWRRRSSTVETFVEMRVGKAITSAAGARPERASVLRTTPAYFTSTRLFPALGTVFGGSDSESGQADEVVLGYGYWRRRFAADTQVLGRTIQVDGRPVRVVGVMGEAADFPKRFDLILPLALTGPQRSERVVRSVGVFGLLKPGVSLSMAQAEMRTISGHLESQWPDTHRGLEVRVITVVELFTAPARSALLALLGAMICLLLIVCSNAANLLYARNAARAHEIAIRMAVGASAHRIVAQLLTECLILALLGALAGLVLARVGLDGLVSALPSTLLDELPRLHFLDLDRTVIAFTLGLAILATLAFGLAPATSLGRASLGVSVKRGGRASTADNRRLARALVMVQVGLATILLIGAGLLTKSLNSLYNAAPGFQPDGLLTASMDLTAPRYAEPDALVLAVDNAVQALQTLPSVGGVAGTTAPPLRGGVSATFFRADLPRPLTNVPWARTIGVTEGYFGVAGIKLLGGRGLDRPDGSTPVPSIVVSQRVARRAFGQDLAIGGSLHVERLGSCRIVGVVNDILNPGLNVDFAHVGRQQREREVQYTQVA